MTFLKVILLIVVIICVLFFIFDMGGVITSESSDYISATFMSSLFKFVDDVELRPGAAGEVHIRSASRVGYSDRGVNRKRVDAIRAKMSAKN